MHDAGEAAAARRLLPGCGTDPGNERACLRWRPSVPPGALLADGGRCGDGEPLPCRGEGGMTIVLNAMRWGERGARISGTTPKSAREAKSGGSWRPLGEMWDRGRRAEALGVLALDFSCCCSSSGLWCCCISRRRLSYLLRICCSRLAAIFPKRCSSKPHD